MRALTVLFAVLLLALQTPAEPLRERAAELPSQEQPEAQDQDMTISFAGHESATREAAGLQTRLSCSCTRKPCHKPERKYGSCTLNNSPLNLCCH